MGLAIEDATCTLNESRTKAAPVVVEVASRKSSNIPVRRSNVVREVQL